MTVSIIKARIDSFTREDEPNENNGDKARLAIRGPGLDDERRVYVYFGRPFPIGATIISAKLRMWLAVGFPGSGPYDFDVYLVDGPWSESGPGGITWSNAPPRNLVYASNQNLSDLDAGDVIEWFVNGHLEYIAAGNDAYGFVIEMRDAVGPFRFYSAEATNDDLRPELEIEWSTDPDKPDNLLPDGGRSVSEAFTKFSWNAIDPDGDEQARFQVQIGTEEDIEPDDSDFTFPEFDSGWVDSPDSEYDWTTGAWSLMVDGEERYWRVRIEDENGNQSEWSEVAHFFRHDKAILTVTAPSTDPFNDATPTISHTFVGGTQRAVRYIIREWDADRGRFKKVYDSGRVATSDTDFELPAGIISKDTDVSYYSFTVRGWDEFHRVATPGDETYVEGSYVGHYEDTGGSSGITNLAEVEVIGPEVRLSWERASLPDYYAVKVDGEFYDTRIDASEISGYPDETHFEYPLWHLAPGEHTIKVMAVEGHDHSDAETIEVTKIVADKWLVAPKLGEYSYGLKVHIMSPDPVESRIGEDGETFFPIGRRDPVRITGVPRGYEGTITGSISYYKGTDAEEFRENLETIKGYANTTLTRLVWGDRNIRVILGAVVINQQPKKGWYDVTIEYWQVANFSFEVPDD